jgi:hypothetical protein
MLGGCPYPSVIETVSNRPYCAGTISFLQLKTERSSVSALACLKRPKMINIVQNNSHVKSNHDFTLVSNLQIDQKSVDGKAILFELRFSQP